MIMYVYIHRTGFSTKQLSYWCLKWQSSSNMFHKSLDSPGPQGPIGLPHDSAVTCCNYNIYILLYYIILYYFILYYIILLYYILLYYIIFDYIISYYIILYYIIYIYIIPHQSWLSKWSVNFVIVEGSHMVSPFRSTARILPIKQPFAAHFTSNLSGYMGSGFNIKNKNVPWLHDRWLWPRSHHLGICSWMLHGISTLLQRTWDAGRAATRAQVHHYSSTSRRSSWRYAQKYALLRMGFYSGYTTLDGFPVVPKNHDEPIQATTTHSFWRRWTFSLIKPWFDPKLGYEPKEKIGFRSTKCGIE